MPAHRSCPAGPAPPPDAQRYRDARGSDNHGRTPAGFHLPRLSAKGACPRNSPALHFVKFSVPHPGRNCQGGRGKLLGPRRIKPARPGRFVPTEDAVPFRHQEGTAGPLCDKKECPASLQGILGAPEGTRTPGLLIRSQTLYPAELPAHLIQFTGGWRSA